jgi:putative flippase GtrA
MAGREGQILNRLFIQFARYASVGLISNAIGYLIYIALTQIGFGSKTAMSLTYAFGVVQTFILNRNWSFRFIGAMKPAFVRYMIAYAIGYVVNLLALMLLVDQAGLPHQPVQGVMILLVAAMLFLLHRFWVFPHASKE